MSTAPIPAVAPIPAAAVCTRYELNAGARKLLRDGMSAREFVEALVKQNDFTSALEFLAYALPPRVGIWWGCLCIQHVFGDKLAGNDRAACIAAVLWVLQPTEQYRTAAAGPAQTAGASSAAGRLAGAVAQLPPNAGQPNQAPAPAGPAAYAPNASVFDALKLTWIKGEPRRMPHLQKQFVDIGLQCGKGRGF